MFRITMSPAAYSNSTTCLAVITHRPSCSRMRRSRGSGMPSRMAETAADMPQSYRTFKNDAQEPSDKTARHRLTDDLLPEIWGSRSEGRRKAEIVPSVGKRQLVSVLRGGG